MTIKNKILSTVLFATLASSTATHCTKIDLTPRKAVNATIFSIYGLANSLNVLSNIALFIAAIVGKAHPILIPVTPISALIACYASKLMFKTAWNELSPEPKQN